MSRSRPRLAALLLLQLALFWGFQQPELMRRLEAPLEDWRLRLLAPTPLEPDPRIALIDIDDASLAQEGRWPWPRQRTAALIEQLQRHHPALIGIDILFPDHATGSALLAQALGRDNITTSLVWKQAPAAPRGELPAPARCLSGCARLPQVGSWISNTPALHTPEQAHITPITDPDGRVRRLYPLVCHPGGCIETLALSLMRQLTGVPPDYQLDTTGGAPRLRDQTGLLQLPLEPDTSLRIPWYHPRYAIPWVSAADVLNQTLPQGWLEGRILLLGSSAVGLHDRIATPVATNFPALETHALLLQGLLDQRLWHTPSAARPGAQLLALLTSALLATLLLRQHPLPALLLGLAANLLWLLWLLLRQQQGEFWPQLPLLAASGATLGLLLPWLTLDALRARDILRHQFSQYVAPQVLERIRQQPERIIGADPERSTMTILFADLRRFSAYAEQIDPEQLAHTLQQLMDRFTQIIYAHGGTVDKYIGDAIMAFWGAPLADADHARHAIAAAQQLCLAMEQLRQNPAMPPLQLSVGVNSGEVVVGEFGSSYRRSYTVIGAPVNLAAHLEAATRTTDAPILVGAATHALLPDHPWPPPLTLRLSGYPTPVTAWPLYPRPQAA
jgi:adenylate cyclase